MGCAMFATRTKAWLPSSWTQSPAWPVLCCPQLWPPHNRSTNIRSPLSVLPACVKAVVELARLALQLVPGDSIWVLSGMGGLVPRRLALAGEAKHAQHDLKCLCTHSSPFLMSATPAWANRSTMIKTKAVLSSSSKPPAASRPDLLATKLMLVSIMYKQPTAVATTVKRPSTCMAHTFLRCIYTQQPQEHVRL